MVFYNKSLAPIIMVPSLAPIIMAPLLAPRSLPRKHHVRVDANVGKDIGAKTCNLGANNNGAKLRVYFLKSY
jgi:hypothetical protein